MRPTVDGPETFQSASGASDRQMADLVSYLAILDDWRSHMNLVGPSAMAEFWPRHAWDSAQLLSFAPGAVRWADVGAGAGFPGVILAIFLKDAPGAQIHLIESLAKRCRFLNEVVARLDLPVVVHNSRAEETRIPELQVVTARACAPMIRLLEFVQPLMRPGVVGLFLKGRDAPVEVEAARRLWRVKAELLESRSSAEGWVVKVEGLSRVKA